MNKPTRYCMTNVVTEFLDQLLTLDGVDKVYAYDEYEDEDIYCDTTAELAEELLWTQDIGTLIIESTEGKHTVVALIAENEADLVSDWAPFHAHHNKAVVATLEEVGDVLNERLGS